MDSALFEQILDEASFLWFQRCNASTSEFYDLSTLIQLDRRLAGLFRLLPSSSKLAEPANQIYDIEDPDKFYCTLIASASLKEINLTKLISAATEAEAPETEIITALAWIEYPIISSTLYKLWESKQPNLQHIAIEAWRLHRTRPDIDLTSCINHPDSKVSCSAIRLIGELCLNDYYQATADKLASKDYIQRFWASYSCALMGDVKGISNLIESLTDKHQTSSSEKETATNTGFATAQVAQATSWINHLTACEALPQYIIKCFEVLGHTKFIPWLIGLTQKNHTSPYASHAFCTITGMALHSEEHGNIVPILADDTALDNEEYEELWQQLPYSGFNEWWTENKEKFDNDKRYFSGKEINQNNMQFIWHKGNQKQRERAAIELALATPSTPLYEHTIPGFRQHSFEPQKPQLQAT